MKHATIICALLGWILFGLTLISPRTAPAEEKKSDGGIASACYGDLTRDGVVDIDDLLGVIGAWGPCPGGCVNALQCDDGNPCTIDSCVAGNCVNTPSTGCCQTQFDCPAAPNATAVCVANQCTYVCNVGYVDCNNDMFMDGCETYVLNDPTSCGGCNQPCNIPNAVAACVNGQCVLDFCMPGYSDCNGQASDGCETNLLTDPFHCGGCGVSVNDGNPCTIDTCVAGAPVHVSLPDNSPCGTGGLCISGVCVP